ncbi:MAG: TldD/PmbA family protein [Clostridiales bacterium]|nr:TldD/PmbA family protein [Clostridiales bacterium]
MTSKSAAERALSEALRSGGDFAELYMEDGRSIGMALIDGKVDSSTTGRTHGAGIRVYKGLSSVYVHGNDTSPDSLRDLARQAAEAVGPLGSAEGRDVRLVGSVAANIHAVKYLPTDVDGAKRARLLHDAGRAARSVDPAITQVRCSLSGREVDVSIMNSEGLSVSDRRVYTRMAISAVASDGTENQTGTASPGAMAGMELFLERLDVEQLARDAATTAVTMLRAEHCPAGVMPVVIGPGFGGVIFHEACGHSLEATQVAFGNSEFAGKLGQRIASPIVTAIDDGTLPNEWGSINIDDEGTPSTRLVLIENGILKNYMVDRLNGRRMGMPSTGSARRQDYAYAPTSRMRNTFIAPGADDEAEIIRTAGDGLYAKQMGGGSVNPATGEFNFAVVEGYLIRDGKIDRPVRGATLIGKGGEVLMKIDRVASNMSQAQGMCGSQSGSVPVNVGQPMIRVTSLTVGGR